MGESAFYCCSTLASVEIPAGVTSIGTAVFYECTGLTSVYMLSETPPSLGVDVFKGSSELVIYVPKGSLDTYRADSEWSKYNLIEFDATAIENVADDALSLAVIGGGIRLNAADGKMVAVYTVGGALVEKFDSYAGEEMILDKGVYIIRAGGESLKVRL